MLRLQNLQIGMQAQHADLFTKLKQAGQEHLVQHYNQITDPALKKDFLGQLERLDLKLVSTLYNDVYKKPNAKLAANFTEMTNYITQEEVKKNKKELEDIGLKAIADGEVGVCIMSGGQGTRLGFDHPKGMFKIGLQSGITLFEFFSKRLRALSNLAQKHHPTSQHHHINWYIMTSKMNDHQIKSFFQQHNYFGYSKDHVVFFAQGGLPALDYHGHIIIETEGKISLAPGGNGAIYYQMKKQGVIEDLKKKHIKYLHIGGIDNILLKVADPACLGYMIKNQLQVVSKFVDKRSPEEKVGIHVINNGLVEVCEYSEMPEQYKAEKNEKGELKFRHSFMATYFMTTQFLDEITSDPEKLSKMNSKYHIAQKKIAIYDKSTKKSIKPTANTGIKFELFCFDCFDQAKSFGLFQIDRDEQFAPVKNATGEDSPETARMLISRLHHKWLKHHVSIKEEPNSTDKLCEINALLTYDGEGLEHVAGEYKEKDVALPIYIK